MKMRVEIPRYLKSGSRFNKRDDRTLVLEADVQPDHLTTVVEMTLFKGDSHDEALLTANVELSDLEIAVNALLEVSKAR